MTGGSYCCYIQLSPTSDRSLHGSVRILLKIDFDRGTAYPAETRDANASGKSEPPGDSPDNVVSRPRRRASLLETTFLR